MFPGDAVFIIITRSDPWSWRGIGQHSLFLITTHHVLSMSSMRKADFALPNTVTKSVSNGLPLSIHLVFTLAQAAISYRGLISQTHMTHLDRPVYS